MRRFVHDNATDHDAVALTSLSTQLYIQLFLTLLHIHITQINKSMLHIPYVKAFLQWPVTSVPFFYSLCLCLRKEFRSGLSDQYVSDPCLLKPQIFG